MGSLIFNLKNLVAFQLYFHKDSSILQESVPPGSLSMSNSLKLYRFKYYSLTNYSGFLLEHHNTDHQATGYTICCVVMDHTFGLLWHKHVKCRVEQPLQVVLLTLKILLILIQEINVLLCASH